MLSMEEINTFQLLLGLMVVPFLHLWKPVKAVVSLRVLFHRQVIVADN